MSKLVCRCGHVISDTTDDLPYKAELLPDSHTGEFYFSGLAEGAQSLIAHLAKCDQAGWLKERGFKEGYPSNLPASAIFSDFVTSLRRRYKRDCYECVSCGRLWIESRRDPNRFVCFTPESQKYEAILGATESPTPNTSLERTRGE